LEDVRQEEVNLDARVRQLQEVGGLSDGRAHVLQLWCVILPRNHHYCSTFFLF